MINLKSIYIITDFDHTITSKDSESSWEVFQHVLPQEYLKESTKDAKYYLPFENNEKIDKEKKTLLMDEWYTKHLNLLIKYKLTSPDIKKSLKNKTINLRKDAQELFKTAYEYNIPIIILSAGISNIIEEFLKENNCLYDNVYIISNIIKFKDGIIKTFRDKMIHSMNKGEIKLPPKVKEIIKNKQEAILLGDNLSDIKMAPQNKKIIKVGFLTNEDEKATYYKNFDIVYPADASFKKLIDMLKANNQQKN